MSRVPLKIKHYSSEELKSLLRKDEKFQQGVRLYACYQISIGKKPKELEDIYHVSFKSICNWVHRLNEGGVEALVDKKRPGRKSGLSDEQKVQLKELVLHKSPADYGYNSSTWTGPLLIDWVSNNFKILYKKAQMYNILKSLHLSFQKGKGAYPEARERTETVETLKKNSNRKEKIKV